MELTTRLLAYAAARPHVLLVEAPGGRRTRMAAQDLLAARGWLPAVSPADADVLLVCGRPAPGLAERVARVWSQMPGPRARGTATGDPAPALDVARESLTDLQAQREDAVARDIEADGGMTDDMPGGLMMAGSGSDRDELQLEQLQPELGPVLPHWPAGLLARLTLQGDVVAAAELSWCDGVGPDRLDERAERLDRAYAVLSLAGSRHAAAVRAGRAGQDVGDLARRVGRDRALRWSLRGLPSLTGEDLWAELLALLPDGPVGRPQQPVEPAGLGEMLVGQELAALRLALAACPFSGSVAPQPARPVRGRARGRRR